MRALSFPRLSLARSFSCSRSSNRSWSISDASMRRARPWAMFHVRGNVHPRSRASFLIAALRFPIQSRGASCQIASCASTVDTCNSLHVLGNRLLIVFSMFVDMAKRADTDTWTSVGSALRRAKLPGLATERISENKNAGLPESAGELARCPAGIRAPDGGEEGAALGREDKDSPGAGCGCGHSVANRIKEVQRPRAHTVGPLIAQSLQGGPTVHYSAPAIASSAKARPYMPCSLRYHFQC